MSEIAQRTSVDPLSWIARLTGEGRLYGLEIPTRRGSDYRWVPAEYVSDYVAAFDLAPASTPAAFSPRGEEEIEAARRTILERYLGQAGPVTLETILAAMASLRIGYRRSWSGSSRRASRHGRFTPQPPSSAVGEAGAEFVDRRALEQIHRRTMGILRAEVQPVPFTTYADFLARWQHLHPRERLSGDGALVTVLQQLRAAPVVGRVWERDVLPLRLRAYEPSELDSLCQSGEVAWIGSGGVDPRRSRVQFLFRGEGHTYLDRRRSWRSR